MIGPLSIARGVTQVTIMAMLYQLESHSPHVPKFGEIARSIEEASNHDPLFPDHVSGSEATAAILVSLAWFETRFHANLIGDNGRSFGLYQIQPPTAKVEAGILLVPATASKVAVDLIRTSFIKCDHLPWPARLSWYIASKGCGSPHPVVVKKSMDRLLMAQSLFRKHYPQSKLPEHARLPEKTP
jgi:hypothetical protein